MGRLKDLTGNKYGRLTVIKRAESIRDPNGKLVTRWICNCDCGKENIVIRATSLISGATVSCGCYSKEIKAINLHNLRKKYNKYDLSNDYGIGYTQNNEIFYFDKEDYKLIKDYNWHKKIGSDYLLTNIDGRLVRMHRLILGLSTDDKVDVDHINHNVNDNRKCNLRISTHQNNNRNTKINSNNTSGYTGIILDKRRNRWVAQIGVDGKSIFLGSSKDKNEAIKLRKEAEEKYFGEYSYDNSMKIANQIKI